MRSACENRMGWQYHQDWNYMGNKNWSFSVVADEGFKRYMRVPQKFGSYLREIVSHSDTIKLNATSGCIYDIGVCREMGEIVLRSGWDVFATAHNLEQNDTLVFKFCGKATFEVQIYDSSDGSQKIASCVNPNPEIFGAVPPSTTSDHHVPNGNEMPCPGHVQKPAEFDYFTSGGSHLTKAQDKNILEMARIIRSETPLYVAVMNKSNVDLKGCSISLPSILMKIVGGVFKGTVKLEAPDSNVYNVSATQQSDGEIVLQSGWNDFVLAHHVQESDIIVLRHKGNSRLEVFILDRNGCWKPPSLFGMEDVIDPPHETVDIIDLSSSSSDDDNIVASDTTKSARLQKLQFDHCAKVRMASTSRTHIKSSHEHESHEDLQESMEARVDQNTLNSNSSEGPSQPPYIISHKVSLSREQEKMVLEKVQAIQSRFPIYVAVMNRSSICVKGHSRLRFTMEYARRYLPSGTHGLTLHVDGCHSEEWQTVLHVQIGRSCAANNMTRISCGWAKFASDNRLQLGDICLFELVTFMKRLKMNVHIIRNLVGQG